MSLTAFVDRRRTSLLLVSLFLVLFGSRAALIHFAGSSVILNDEWDGDFAGVAQPLLQGRLSIHDLLAPFNEHRILFTRLLVISIFKTSGYLDVILEMIVNAVLGAATVVVVSLLISRVLVGGASVAVMIVAVAINAAPFAYENELLGFNTHFYLLNAFSFAGLFLLADSRAWSPRWTAGFLCALASCFCLASGALTFAAAAVGHVLQAACGCRRGKREWFGIAALAGMAVATLSVVPHVASSDQYRAHSLGEFLQGLYSFACWPADAGVGLLLWLPGALFLLRTISDRPAASDPRWFNIMALLWVAAQMVALAVGRANFTLHSRYSDWLLFGLTINLTGAVWLFQARRRGDNHMRWRVVALTAWLCLFAWSVTHPQRHLPSAIVQWRDLADLGAKNVRGYLATGDASFLVGSPMPVVPYPDAQRLRQYLDSQEARVALPPDLTAKGTARPWVEAIKAAILRLGFVWVGAGAVLLLAVLAPGTLRQARLGLRQAPGPPSPASCRVAQQSVMESRSARK
jgi:hypothetical protein